MSMWYVLSLAATSLSWIGFAFSLDFNKYIKKAYITYNGDRIGWTQTKTQEVTSEYEETLLWGW